MFKPPTSIVSPEQRQYAQQVNLHNPHLSLNTSVDGKPLTNKQMAENLLCNHRPYESDYKHRITLSNMLLESDNETPENIVNRFQEHCPNKKCRNSECPRICCDHFGLLYEYRDKDNRVVYVGYTRESLNKRKNGHNSQVQKDRSPFHDLLQKDRQLTTRIVGIGTPTDEANLIVKRFISGHPVLNSQIASDNSLDLYVDEWRKNRQFVLCNGIPSVRHWNMKTSKLEHESKTVAFIPRDYAVFSHRSKCRRLTADQEKLKNREKFAWFDPTHVLAETVCCVCGTLGLISEKDAHKYPLTHVNPACCGQETGVFWSPEQASADWPHNQRCAKSLQ